MKKKILIIILSFFFIALLIGGGILLRNISIQRQEHVDELMQIELPDIVFILGRENQYGNYQTRIIDSKGSIYFFNGGMKFEKILQNYNSGELQKKWKNLGKVNDIELREKYVVFLEIKDNPNYRFIYDEDVPKGISPSYTWYGCYYNESGGEELFKFYEREYVDPSVTDERGKELAGWVSVAVYD